MSAEYFAQLVEYTKEVDAKLGIAFDAHKKPNYRDWDAGGPPSGFVAHFTASNVAITKTHPIGRIPVILRRFARNSGGPPGIHFVAWDVKQPEFESLRAKYPVFKELNCDVFSWGLDKAFYHASWVNGWAFGLENRNVGRLWQKSGQLMWGKGVPYVGRPPMNVRSFMCEPYTRQQIEANILIMRWLRQLYPIQEHRIIGHVHVTSNRTDPMPHYPFALVRRAVFEQMDVSTDKLEWLNQYTTDPDFYQRYDNYVEEMLVSEEPDEVQFGRGDPEPMDFEDVESLYGSDKQITLGNEEEVRRGLVQLEWKADSQVEYDFALRMFQNRWVKKVGGRWIHTMKVTGDADEATCKKMTEFLHFWGFV